MALQIEAYGPKKIEFHAEIKDCHFGNFSQWAGMAVPCYTMRKNLPKTLDQLVFCKYTLVFSKFLPPKRRKTLRSY